MESGIGQEAALEPAGAAVILDTLVDGPAVAGIIQDRPAVVRAAAKSEIHSIQYLRGLAAIGVLAYHISEQFSGGFGLGAAGVDLFFIISGFIMWVTTAGRDTTPQRFALRRIVRIVPLYWVVTCVTALGILVAPQFFFGHVLSVVNFIGSLVFLPIIYEGKFHPVALQGWTLCYEMLFYAVFGLCLFLKQSWRPPLLIVVFGALAALHPLLPDGYLGQYTDPIILEFIAGLLIGLVWTNRRTAPLWLAVALFLVGAVALFLTQFVAADVTRLLRWGIPSAFVVTGIILIEKAHPRPPIRLLSFFGDASYSIYLWHVLLASVCTAVVLRLHLPLWLQPLAIFAACLSAATILYLVIEKPLIRLLRPR